MVLSGWGGENDMVRRLTPQDEHTNDTKTLTAERGKTLLLYTWNFFTFIVSCAAAT